MSRRTSLLLGALLALAIPAGAQAAVSPLGLPCTTAEPGGSRYCGSDPSATGTDRTRVFSFDNVPLDTSVALPPESLGDGPFPLVVLAHGWGGAKLGFAGSEGYYGSPKTLADKGFAVLTSTARGFAGSCGNAAERLVIGQNCALGFIRLDDYRFEAMDIMFLAGKLVDQGVARPGIGVTGNSYGGGVSLELAVLKNRMCEDLYVTGDATQHPCKALAPWVTKLGTPMHIAAAAPVIPWSDLVYSLVPNGRTLDYTVTNPYVSTAKAGDNASEPGVEKQSFVSGLYGTGLASGYYQPTPLVDQTDTKADLTTWFARLNAGEPYADPVVGEMIDLIARYRSPYNMPFAPDGPAPLFISNGWTDDLFPADEAVRFYNRVLTEFPNAAISLHFADHGHARGSNGAGDLAVIRDRIQTLFLHHLQGQGAAPANRAEGFLTSCPAIAQAGPAFSASSWAGLHPGEIRFLANADATVPPQGDPRENQVSDPIAGGDACGSVPDASDAPGSATYRLPAVKGTGYTLLGSPTVVGKFALQSGTAAQLVGRLWDVAPDGSEILVAKGVYRPTGEGTEVFQLHGNGWKFAPGHTPRLQLLGSDSPSWRPSNSPAAITASAVGVRLPVAETADCDQVLAPASPVLPEVKTGLSRTPAPGVQVADAGTCSSPKLTSAGSKPGTAGGATLTPQGDIRGSAGSNSRLKARIRFGVPRHRGLARVRRHGITVRITCSAACRSRGVLRFGTRKIGAGAKRAAKQGTRRMTVRITPAGVRRVRAQRIARVRMTVTVRDSAGRKAKQRTGRFFLRTRKR